MDKSIILDIVVMVSQVYAYVQVYQTVYIKYVQFIAYQFYLNKAVFKKKKKRTVIRED